MIVCATPRCGGTIFCVDKAAEIKGTFMGELSPGYITGLGVYGTKKQENHETGFQPVYGLDEYFTHLSQIGDAGRIYLVNEAVSLALPLSSYRIATRRIGRAFRSAADLLIRAQPDEAPERLLFIINRFCRGLLESNILITRYCKLSSKPLLIYEDMYRSKSAYPNFEAFSLRSQAEEFFARLEDLDATFSGTT